MEAPDLNVIKEIPGYKVIMKAILKTQIQQLVEQLATHADEESVLITASLSDGTLSHLGSDTGKSFLEKNESFKSHFLGFCLKRQHLKKVEKDQEEQQLLQQQQLPQYQQLTLQIQSLPWGQGGKGSGPGPSLETPAHKSHPHQRTVPSKGVRHKPYPISNPQRSRILDSIAKASQESCNDAHIVKPEPEQELLSQSNEGEALTSHDNNSNEEHGSESRDLDIAEDGNSDTNPSGDGSYDPDVIVKTEAVNDAADSEPEITGVELGAKPIPSSQKDPSEANVSMVYPVSTAVGGPGNIQSPSNVFTDSGQRQTSSGKDKHVCGICEKGFSTRYNLSVHMRLHKGERPFECSVCLRRFTQKINLQTHMLVHYRDTINQGGRH